MSWAVNPRHQHDTAARCCAMLRDAARLELPFKGENSPLRCRASNLASWKRLSHPKLPETILGYIWMSYKYSNIFIYIYVIFYNSINICACLILFDDISWSQNSQLESNGISYNDLPSWGRKALCRNASLGSRWPHLSFLHFFQFLLLRLGE